MREEEAFVLAACCFGISMDGTSKAFEMDLTGE